MLGLTGFSDMRDVKAEYKKGNPEAILAYNLYAYHVKKYIGAYVAVLNGLDALVFTAGVGENDDLARKLSTQNLEYLGIYVDEERNSAGGSGVYEINATNSSVKILVVPTNEELEIAQQCFTLVSDQFE
jgi:acetate kinase